MNWWLGYLTIFILATAITAAITPACRALSWKLGILDRPLGEHHKKHSEAKPLLGGLAMLLGWLLTVYSALWFIHFFQGYLPDWLTQQLPGALQVRPLLLVVASGATVLTVMGLIDDKKPFGPLTKLLLQLLICAGVALYPKLRITFFIDSQLITWLITLCWFIVVINAFNFFDNMDGLASGVAAIAAILFTLNAGLRGQFFVAALSAATAGSALGFYFFNCFPATIFMGDSGSHFLGYTLSVLGTLTSFYSLQTSPTLAPILIPILVLGVPIFDAFAVIIIRMKSGEPIYHGDHNHISHRFLRMGADHKTAVILVHLLSLAIGLGALTLLWLETKGAVLVLTQSIIILMVVTILHRITSDQYIENKR